MANLPTSVTIEYDRLVNADNWDGVRALLEPLVRSGVAEAQYLWAMSSRPGESEDEFHARHVDSVKVAAESGYAPALFTQGMYHLFGEMASLDKGSAVKSFAAAARHGYPPAQYEYGLALVHGVGAAADIIEGMRLIQAAAAAGNEYAREFVAAKESESGLVDGHKREER